MTSKQLLLTFLKTQKINAWKSGNWNKIEITIEKDEDGTNVSLKDVEIGFSFDKRGKFLGIYNWKD